MSTEQLICLVLFALLVTSLVTSIVLWVRAENWKFLYDKRLRRSNIPEDMLEEDRDRHMHEWFDALREERVRMSNAILHAEGGGGGGRGWVSVLLGHLEDPCMHCGVPMDDVEPGVCPARVESVYRIDLKEKL